MRSSQTASGSPIETQTSVCSKSHPATASSTLAVSVKLGAGLVRDLPGSFDDLVIGPEGLPGGKANVHP